MKTTLKTRMCNSAPHMPLTTNRQALLQSLFLSVLLLVACAMYVNTASAQSTDSAVTTRNVVVGEGETLRSIARRELGKSGLASMLANFNELPESQALVPGQVLRIPLFTPAERQFATVIFTKGDVTKNDEAVKRDDKIYLLDTLKTGEDGFASLQFASGSVINLQPMSVAKIERLNCLETDDSCLIVLDASKGEVSSDVRRRDGQPTEFTINTPYASAAVRGTVFDMAADDQNKLVVGVIEGDVVVEVPSAELALVEGFGAVAEVNEPVSDPIALLPAPVFRYIPTRAASGDRITWWALTDASNYAVSLTLDEQGQQTLSSVRPQDSLFTVDDLAAGEYYVHVRGVDVNGLKGFTTPTKVIVAAIDESVAPVNTAVTRTDNEFLVAVIDPPDTAPGYEIQISTTADFLDPLSVDVNNIGSAIFRLESDKIFARSRILIEPQLVSAFGDTVESN